MARDLLDENYYVTRAGRVPVKWCAPEVINYMKYTTASDMWSYGCVLYEIWSFGHKPYTEQTNAEVCFNYGPNMTVLNETVFAFKGNCNDNVRGAPSTTSWLSKGRLSAHGTVLVSYADSQQHGTHKTAQWLRYYGDDCRSRRRRRFGMTVKIGGEER